MCDFPPHVSVNVCYIIEMESGIIYLKGLEKIIWPPYWANPIGSAIRKETNPKYHTLITKFKEKTGCSVVVNTSFNVRGEPIVCTPKDAFKCFMGTELDLLVVGNCILRKEQQDKSLIEDYKEKYELD